MRLALDATYALDREPSGVARYSTRIIEELARLPDIDMRLCARWPPVLRLRRHFDRLRFRACWLQEPLNFRLADRIDIFHGLNQRLPRYKFRRQVVTVHDVFPLTSANYSTPEFRCKFSRVISDAVRRADRIICVSAYTRDQLCGALDVPPEMCSVIHHGVEQDVPPPSAAARQRARRLAGDGPFFLCVGAVQERKNTAAAIEAVAAIGGAHLVVAGGMGHGSEGVRDLISRRGLRERVRLLGFVRETTLDALYAEATALLFPSLEEGFGMPMLEAMSRGLPVIAANTSAIPEVTGDAAVLLDPSDVDGMSRAAHRMLEDAPWRESWIARGRARAGLFTWARAAAATMDVYNAELGMRNAE